MKFVLLKVCDSLSISINDKIIMIPLSPMSLCTFWEAKGDNNIEREATNEVVCSTFHIWQIGIWGKGVITSYNHFILLSSIFLIMFAISFYKSRSKVKINSLNCFGIFTLLGVMYNSFLCYHDLKTLYNVQNRYPLTWIKLVFGQICDLPTLSCTL